MGLLRKFKLIGFLVITFAILSTQASSLTDPYYIAGVVEFQPASSSLNSLDRVNNNLADYLKIINSDQAAETDIIVFPEGTLNNVEQLTYVPSTLEYIAPCDNPKYADFLQQLSCYAKLTKKYIVINLTEKEDCTEESQLENEDPRPCSSYGLSAYNTNVVFDRNGVVISRYRKWNLYNEPWNITQTPEFGLFYTDFGVRFGHFICFDILFYTPASVMVKTGVKDFIFPTMWFSQLPFLTGVQIQQSWAYSYDVNLLAAGTSDPSIGSTGSGIFAGTQGPLISVMNSSPVRKLYVAKVPKRGFAQLQTATSPQLQIRNKRAVSTSTLNGLLVKRDARIDEYTTSLLDASKQSTQLCHGSFCCNFNIVTKSLATQPNSSSYQYRYAAYSGIRLYTNREPIYTRICSIFACLDETLESCAVAFDESVTVSPKMSFESITIEADFAKTNELLLMPNSVDEFLMPLTVDSFVFNVTDKGTSKNVHFELLASRDNLMNFGIFGNYFDGYSSGMTVTLSSLVFVSSLLVAVKYLIML